MTSSAGGEVPPILYVFRGGRRQRLQHCGPTDFLYGFPELSSAGAPVEMITESELGLERVLLPASRMLSNALASATDVHPRCVSAFLRSPGRDALARADVVVATTQSYGLALAALGRLGLHRARVILLAMGVIEPEASALRKRWLAMLLRDVTIAALSRREMEFLAGMLGAGADSRYFQFGVDLEFWTSDAGLSHGREVFSIGNDSGRDYETLIAAWRPEFPPLTIITSLPVAVHKPNVRILAGDWRSMIVSDEGIREYYRRATLVVIPLRDTIQPSGQTAVLQAMACARPVVLSANRGLWDRAMLERHRACRLVSPGDPTALAATVAELLAAPNEAAAMGARARRMLEIEDVSTRAMARQIASIARSLVGRS